MDTGGLSGMDGEVPAGCSPAPAPGECEGSGGGQTPPGDGKIPDAKPATVFKRWDKVALRRHGKWLRGDITEVYELPNETAYNVLTGRWSYKVRASDLISEADYDRMIFDIEQPKRREHWSRELEAYNAGATTSAKLAEALKISTRVAGRKLAAMRRWQLIPETPPNDEATTSGTERESGGTPCAHGADGDNAESS
jgi:hypothetical protein